MDITTQKTARQAGHPHYFTGKPCKRGHTSPRYTHNGTCTACHLEYSKVYNKTVAGKETTRKTQSAYRETAKGKQAVRRYLDSPKGKRAVTKFRESEKYQTWLRQYQQSEKYREYRKMLRDLRTHLGHNAASNAKRRAIIKQALAPWADVDKIKQVYMECAERTLSTGIPHNVDHIIPLSGRTVCGLHVENNLRIITATENFRRPRIHAP